MKFHYLFAALLLTSLFSCDAESDTPEKTENKGRVVAAKRDYQHIIAESQNDYPTALRSIKDVEIYDRDVLEIHITEDGSFTIEGKKANWKILDEEVDKFFNMNRNLSSAQTAEFIRDENYEGASYPFFTQMTKPEFQSFIDQLTRMSETDMQAGLYLQRHSRSFKAFERGHSQLSFMYPMAVIRYVHSDDLAEDKLLEFENHLAKNLYEMREQLAQEWFGVSYESIRQKATKSDEGRLDLLYLQEMYPAYLLKIKESELEISEMPEPPPPPPVPEPPIEIEIIDDERDAPRR